MNSLEFINQEIEDAKHEIKVNEIRIENMYNKTFYEERAEVLNNKLQTLQQIKVELESWEVVKEKFFIDIIERESDYKIGFEPKTPIINGTVTRFAHLDNDKGTTFKKALEVK